LRWENKQIYGGIKIMELVKVKNDNGVNLVSARELHGFLEIKSKFVDWIERRISNYGFEENVDFTKVSDASQKKEASHGGQNKLDYILKIDMAKELSMVENNDKGRQARKYFIECEKKLVDVSTQSQQQRLYERSPQELLADNAIALNKMFETLKLNIPKEIIVASAIQGTSNAIGYNFPEVQCLLNKQDEEVYHTKSEICKRVGIKANKVNLALIELGIQVEGTTSMQPYALTDLGREYAVERSYTKNGHQGYEIKLKESAEDYIRENIGNLPTSWVK
jgi:phage anti-repressor protein